MNLLHGNNLDLIRAIPDNSVDAIVTDPPYGLGKEPDALAMLRDWIETGHHDVKSKSGFMGKTWDNFVPHPVQWRECYRVLKSGGHLLSFAGTRTQDLVALGLRLAGFEIRDLVAWIYGSGFPKSHNLEGEWDGWGTALKPALEPITLARKPLEGTVAENVLKWHTGALNVDGCRVSAPEGKTSGGCAGSSRPHGGGISDRTPEDSTKGRWPANLIHDGSEEVVGLFPDTKSGVQKQPLGTGGLFSRKSNTPCAPQYGDSGSAARFFYCAKVSPSERNAWLSELPDKEWKADGAAIPQRADRPFKPSKNNHPTVKPIALMRYLCRLVTPPGGTVLDPWMGSGSTGKAAKLEGFDFIGMEQDAGYFAIAQARCGVTPEAVDLYEL